ncbi:hypothetical protein HOLleu_00804 [Holothuria leucospilota]|uniref:Uncharacterized protein n=1 Tax=Holothuria leucospilota TaxID=206669 RepID=A0A9Q1CP43_HOLLE|nr:hypothetical protein HOLleu_00804 [Holothuria leucospilota]
MSELSTSHPDVHQKLMAGEFVVQRQSQYAFSQLACDQAIEQTCNRDTKTKGGLTGFSINKGAVHRWMLSSHERATITSECEAMAGKNPTFRSRKDLDKTRVHKDEEHTKDVIATIDSMINPFETDRSELVHISSGVVAPADVTDDMVSAHSEGEGAFQVFCEERFQHGSKDMFATLPRQKLVIGNSRQIDVREMMKYSLGPLPLSLATCQGSLVKSNKAKLMNFFEGGPEVPPHIEAPPNESVWIIDGMALLQQIKCSGITFGVLADQILRMLLSFARSNGSKFVHFVTDRYMNNSIKNAERVKRGSCGVELIKIYADEQSVPKQWKKFLSGGSNKEALIEYLFKKWSNESNTLGDVTIFVAHGPVCHKLFQSPGSSNVSVEEVNALHCNHEEADTRMFLHCAYAVNVTQCRNIIFKSPDTDVMVIALSMCTTIQAKLYFSTGVGNKKRIIDINQIADNLGQGMCYHTGMQAKHGKRREQIDFFST